MKKVLFATGNDSKAKRFKDGLLRNGIEIITIKDIDEDIEVLEDGKDAIENALIKARAYAKVLDIPVFAMDDSLYIDNIPDDKQPGLYVRRVNGKRLSDEEWSKNDFYIVDKLSDKIDPGYPLNTISINKKLNKYFTDMTKEDYDSVKEDESDVVEFLWKNLSR